MGESVGKSTGDVFAKMMARVAIMVVEFIALAAIGKRLGPDDYALWSQTILTATLLVPLATFALDRAIVRLLPFELGRAAYNVYRALVGLTLVAGVFLGGILWVGRSLAAELVYGSSSQSSLLIFVAGLLLGRSLFLVGASYFQADAKIRTHAAIEVLWALGRIGVLCLFPLALQWNLRRTLTMVVSWELALAVGVIICAGAVLHRRKPVARTRLSCYYAFSLPLVPAALTYWIMTYADRLFIVHFRGLTELGQYAGAYRLATVLSLFYASFSFALPPVLFRLWERGRKAMASRMVILFTHGYLILAIPTCVGVSHLSPVVVRVLATGEFEVSRLLVFILTAALLGLGLNAIWTKVIHLEKKTKSILAIYSGAALLNCVLNFLLIPKLGILGAGLSTLAAYGILAFVMWRMSSRVLNRVVQSGYAVRIVVAAVLVYGALLWWRPDTVTSALLWAFAYMLGYGMVLWALLGFPRSLRVSSILFRGGDVPDGGQ